MTTMQDGFAFDINQRVVIRTVKLGFKRCAEGRHHVGKNTDDMRRTAQRITILQPGRGIIGAEIGKVILDKGGDAGLPRMGFGSKQAFVKMGGIAQQPDRGKCCDARGQAAEVIRTHECLTHHGGHDRRAIHDCQGFLGTQR